MLKKKCRNNKGFTLVELIVVLVILAILAAILVPALLGYIDEAKKKQYLLDARNLFMATQSKLSEIYAQRGTYQICRNDPTNAYYNNHDITKETAYNVVENGRGKAGAVAWVYDYSFSRDVFRLAGYSLDDPHPDYNWYQKNYDNKNVWNTKENADQEKVNFLCVGVGSYDKYLKSGTSVEDQHKAYTAYFMIYQPNKDENFYLFDGNGFVEKWPFKDTFVNGKNGGKFKYVLNVNGEDITIQFLVLKTENNKNDTADSELKEIDKYYTK